MPNRVHPEIADGLMRIGVIDCHEHLPEESERVKRKLDFGDLLWGYAASDLAVAGLSPADHQRLTSPDVDLDEKWRLIEPYYPKVRYTAYFRVLQIALRDLYGIDEISRRTWHEITEQIRRRNKPGFYRWVLKEKAGIEVSLNNSLEEWPVRHPTDPELFLQDLSVVKLLDGPLPIKELQAVTGEDISRFDHYRDAIDKCFAKYAPITGAVKQQAAYGRSLHFEDVPADRARRVFDSMTAPETLAPADLKVLQDWAMHHCVQLCIEHDLTMKIHTGYLAGFDYMPLEHTRPSHLNGLFIKYPNARFDLFHIGYPYQEEVLALAKHFRHVYTDMCWVWIIDPLAARRFFKQAVLALPGNKVFGFGGDYPHPENAYGHLQIAREQMGIALTELLEEGWLDVAEAIEVAQRVLHDNPVECFRIDQKRQALRQSVAEIG